ncbi:MAG: helix-turn-helix domain-containing protein [Bacteroidota bacterium]
MTSLPRYERILCEDPEITSFVRLYYVHRSDDPTAEERITYYPNYCTTLNIYRNDQVRWTDLSRTHTHAPNAGFNQLLVSRFDKTREIVMKGRFDKLTIVFWPLGINRFLSTNLSKIGQEHFAFFDHFGPPFESVLEEVFNSPKITEKRALLDTFFKEQLQSFQAPKLQQAIDSWLGAAESLSVDAMANRLAISRKTLLRQFRKHLMLSPSEFKSILKFRKALHHAQTSPRFKGLSDLAYTADYYDQSDLNAHFKIKTGMTPKQLFQQIQTIDEGLFWNYRRVPKVQD